MADTQNTNQAPEGLDDFLAAEDPQAAVAAQGMKQIGGAIGRAVEDKRTDEAIEPVSSPIDLLAGAAGARLGGAMARNAGQILGNEVGSIGASIPEGLEAGSAGRAQVMRQYLEESGHPVAPGRGSLETARNYVRAIESAQQAGIKGVSPSHLQEAQREVNRIMDRGGYADGGEVAAPPAGLDEFIAPEMQQEQLGTPTELAKTAAEGLGQGFAGPLAPMAEQAAGIDPEAIRARAEANPLTHYGSELAGLAGGLLTGTGEAALAAKAGELGVSALRLSEGAGAAAKIGSAALKGAIENGIIQGSDETSKMVLRDPSQTSETALVDIGLAGLLGATLAGGVTAVSPLWKATAGNDTHHLLTSVANKLGGVEGTDSDAIQAAIKNSGLEVSPEVRSALSSDPAARQAFQLLQESATSSGLKAQKAVKDFKTVASDAIVRALDKTPEDVAALSHLSEFDAGENIKKSLVDSLKASMDPISERFNTIREKFKGELLPLNSKVKVADEIANLMTEEGYSLSPSSPQHGTILSTIKELPNLNTLEDLRQYQSILGDKTYGNPDLRRVGGQLRSILRNAEEEVVLDSAGKKTPEIIGEHKAARAAYKEAMSTIDNLNDRLHVGKFSGPSSFISAIKEMAPEDVLRRLSPKGDAAIIGELSKFPTAASALKDYHLSKLLKTASGRAGEGEVISVKALRNGLEKLSPEMRDFVISPEAASKINSITSLVDALPGKLNTSGTAKTLDLLWATMPSSAGMLAAVLGGHNPIIGALLGHTGKLLGREAPDAVRLSMLKFLGSNKPVDAAGFKSMADYLAAAVRGDTLVNKAVKSVFKAKTPLLPSYASVSESDRNKLDKRLQDLQKNPMPAFDTNSDLAHYMPEHDQSLAQNTSNIVNFLNNARPSNTQSSPLDRPMPVTAAQKADYNRVLTIAQQPLSILDRVKNGNITPADVMAMSSMYPSLYNRLIQSLTNEMTNTLSKGDPIPYKTRMGMSMFMAQALDSSMTPTGIASAQPMTAAEPPSQGTPSKGRASAPGLQKLPTSYQTPAQSRAVRQQRQK